MTQPANVPVSPADRVRPSDQLPPATGWKADRPGDLTAQGQPVGRRLGTQGSDVGYGLKLAKRFSDRLQLAGAETVEDAIAGCFPVGAKRAACYGRSPVIYDFELAFTLWGFLAGAPKDLVDFRTPLFTGAAHHYWEQRDIVDRVPEETLRLTPAEVAGQLPGWRSLLRLEA